MIFLVPFCWWNFDISNILIFIFLLLGRSPTLNFIPRNSVQSLLKTCMINSRNLKRTTSTSSQVRSPFSSWFSLPSIKIFSNMKKIWKKIDFICFSKFTMSLQYLVSFGFFTYEYDVVQYEKQYTVYRYCRKLVVQSWSFLFFSYNSGWQLSRNASASQDCDSKWTEKGHLGPCVSPSVVRGQACDSAS